MIRGGKMYDKVDFPFLVIQKGKDRVQIDRFKQPDDAMAFYDFIKNHTDLYNLEDLRLCVTVLMYNPEENKHEKKHA